ncbi:MAG: hypothetical protein Terrestrivirus1_355 [Terrestrivirus sp.]|uniref:Uncharacterized protein n=1 Tax=Terrestrivirus sp. TaxID=2487775 RepID=A0A3G4ZNC6_9VIRU|nr:MAG: hypothetical protein Terrestrivirus1_355 [Terrestrivirus sp.]
MYDYHELSNDWNLELIKKYFTENGFSKINDKNNYECTLFHLACYYGHYDIVKYLTTLPEFTSLNDEAEYGNTPLLVACAHNYTNIVTHLLTLENLTTLNHNGFSGKTPFIWARTKGNIDIIKELLKRKDIDISGDITLYYSSENKNKIKKLIKQYKSDPVTTRQQLILGEYLNIYRLVIFLCDGFLEFTNDVENKKASQFFNIMMRLPLELQTKIIYTMANSSMNNINGKVFDDGLKEFVKKFI